VFLLVVEMNGRVRLQPVDLGDGKADRLQAYEERDPSAIDVLPFRRGRRSGISSMSDRRPTHKCPN